MTRATHNDAQMRCRYRIIIFRSIPSVQKHRFYVKNSQTSHRTCWRVFGYTKYFYDGSLSCTTLSFHAFFFFNFTAIFFFFSFFSSTSFSFISDGNFRNFISSHTRSPFYCRFLFCGILFGWGFIGLWNWTPCSRIVLAYYISHAIQK